MDNTTYLLRELPLLTVCKTKKLTEAFKTYILLAANDSFYTVYTNEGKGFVMTAETKKIEVEILYKPEGNPETLLDCTYPDVYEKFKEKAIEYLRKREKKLEGQKLEVWIKLKNAERRFSEEPLSTNKNLQKIILLNSTFQQDLIVEEDDERSFPEGKEKYRLHKSKERNRELIRLAKEQHLQNDSKLSCQVCGFSFVDTYGEIGHGFIEAHHIFPISQLTEETATKIEDLALVCSNCHRMLHRRRPWLTIDNLKAIRQPNE